MGKKWSCGVKRLVVTPWKYRVNVFDVIGGDKESRLMEDVCDYKPCEGMLLYACH